MNLIEVGDEGDVEPEMEREVIRRDETGRMTMEI